MRLAAREPEHLAELARVAEVHRGPVVLELEAQMSVRVGREARLLLGREARARGGREQPRAGRARGEQLSGHAQVQHEPRAVVERGEQVLAVPLEPGRRASGERAAQPCGRGDEEVARPRGAHAADPAAHEMGRDPAARHLDFGELGHGVSAWAPRGRSNTRAFRFVTAQSRDPPISEDLAVSVA